MYDRVVSGELVLPLGQGATETVGGKAAGLAKLMAAGLAVPPGVVVTMNAFRTGELPEIEPPPGPLAVRSSATIEDGERGAAPGLFLSKLGVAPGRELTHAIREVWASADRPAVGAYLEARNIERDRLAVAVIVQQQISPIVARGTIYSRLPGDRASSRMLIEQGDERDWRELERDDDSPLVQLALHAERALGVDAVDVEWVQSPDRSERPTPPSELFAFSKRHPERVWRWDVAHNPDPLSPAQIGLVERVGGESMCVVGGYLYLADPPGDAQSGSIALDTSLLDAMGAALAGCDGSLESALTAYDEVYRIYADQLGPVLSAARRELPEFLRAHVIGLDVDRAVHAMLGAPSTARLETLVAAVARGDASRDELLEAAAPFAPAWDVAVPTYGEHPALLDAAVDAARPSAAAGAAAAAEADVRERLAPGVQAEFDGVLERARRAADIAELDDRYFARAQAEVRRALLALGDEDIFYMPLADVASGVTDPQRVSEARARIEHQRGRAMPLAFSDGAPLPAAPPSATDCWRGRGCGGQARGRVARLSSLAAAPDLPAGSVLVAPSVTPAMTFLLHQTAAVISEHGGLLDHGAAIARELGVPCVVGCRGAWTHLRDGDTVWLDGAEGIVIRLRADQS
jgi:pyruvate,water dikinase